MPSAWTQNHYHAVFSTKNRASLITPEIEARLHPFLGGIVRDMGCTLLWIRRHGQSVPHPDATERHDRMGRPRLSAVRNSP